MALVAITTLGVVPVAAQSMPGMNMPGMKMPMPAKKPAAKPTAKRKAAPQAIRSTTKRAARPATAGAPMSGTKGMDHTAIPGMGMSAGNHAAPEPMHDMRSMRGMAMPTDQHSGDDMRAISGMAGMPGMAMDGVQQTGTALPAGDAPAPVAPTDHAADRAYSPQDMVMARHHLQHHHGGQDFHQIMFNLAEYQFRNGRDGYRWDGEAWFGGDIDRLFVKTEGEGTFRRRVDSAEAQALYSRAIGPYFNLQAGVRQDFGPSPRRTYATAGLEGLAAGFFEVNAAAFLSNKGELLGRVEGYYDQRITQRLILQPRAELNLAAQNVPENRIGSGLSNAELGLRLRYEVRREFAPYVGVSWDRKVGDTARFTRAAGEDATARSIVAGARVWF